MALDVAPGTLASALTPRRETMRGIRGHNSVVGVVVAGHRNTRVSSYVSAPAFEYRRSSVLQHSSVVVDQCSHTRMPQHTKVSVLTSVSARNADIRVFS